MRGVTITKNARLELAPGIEPGTYALRKRRSTTELSQHGDGLLPEGERLVKPVLVRRMRPLSKRFWDKVDRSSEHGCWPWKASLDGNGRYGVFGYWSNRKQRTYRAHRIAWLLVNGEIPPGLEVRHYVCGNTRCCNPAHLKLGTHAENCSDTVRMGRSTVGERNPRAKLTSKDVSAIRMSRAQGETTTSISERYGIGTSHVSQICTGVIWGSVPFPSKEVSSDLATAYARKHTLAHRRSPERAAGSRPEGGL